MNTVLITGANRGIGLGFARHYLKAGWVVFATARNPGASEAFHELSAEYGERFVAVPLDVVDEASIQSLAGTVAATSHKLNLLINNAGYCPEEEFGHWTAEGFETSFRVNAIGPALVTQALMPHLREGGKVVNLASGMGSMGLNINPDNGLDAYAVSKAALNSLTLRLAEKLKPRSITAIAISPGWVQTDMGGPDALLSVSEAVERVAAFIETLIQEQGGCFFSGCGERLPW